MNIKVTTEDMPVSHLTGGEYALSELTVYVDPNLPYREKQGLIIHAIIENYDRSMPHDKVEELTEFIIDALDELGVDI